MVILTAPLQVVELLVEVLDIFSMHIVLYRRYEVLYGTRD